MARRGTGKFPRELFIAVVFAVWLGGCGESPDHATLIGGGRSHGDPNLSVTPASLDFQQPVQGDPAPQSLSVANTGDGVMAWTASWNETWLTVAPSSGSVAGGASETLTVSVSSSGLAPGTYTDTITVSAPGAVGSPVQVAVSFLVLQEADAAVSPSSLSFSATQDGLNPDPKILTVENLGGKVLTWTAGTNPAASWLTVAPASGEITGGQNKQLLVSVNITGLAANTYNTDIEIASNDPASPTVVPVTLTVAPPPTIHLAPTSIDTTSVENVNNPPVEAVLIRNDGGGDLLWQAADDSGGWLVVTPSEGVLGSGQQDTMGIIFNTLQLSAGDYSATVTVTGLGATNTPQTITVTLHVTPQPVISASPSTVYVSAVARRNVNYEGVISLANTGSGVMSWTLSENTSWLSLPYDSGVVSATPQQVTVEANPRALGVGLYTGIVTVQSPEASNSPQQVNVVLSVEGVAGSGWPLARADYARSALAAYAGPLQAGLQAVAPLPGNSPSWVEPPSSIVVDKGGRIYVSGSYTAAGLPSARHSVLCFSSEGVVWEYVNSMASTAPSGGTAISADGMIYSALGGGGFVSLFSEDGSLYWANGVNPPVQNQVEVFLGLDGLLYSQEGVWSSSPEGMVSPVLNGPFAHAAVVPATGGVDGYYMIVSDGTDVVKGYLWTFDSVTDTWSEYGLRWSVDVSDTGVVVQSVAANPILRQCYVVTSDGDAVGIGYSDPDNPQVLWRQSLGAVFSEYASPAVSSVGYVLFRSDGPASTVFGVHEDGSGTPWNLALGYRSSSPVCDEQGNFFVWGEDAGFIRAGKYAAPSGATMWTYDGSSDGVKGPAAFYPDAAALSPTGGFLVPYDGGIAIIGKDGGEGLVGGLIPPWPLPNADSGNTRRTDVDGPHGMSVSARWVKQLNGAGGSWSTPPVCTIYDDVPITYWGVDLYGNVLFALDKNGERMWSKAVSGLWMATDEDGGVLVADGTTATMMDGAGRLQWDAALSGAGGFSRSPDAFYMRSKGLFKRDGSTVEWFPNHSTVHMAEVPCLQLGRHIAFDDVGGGEFMARGLNIHTTETDPTATVAAADTWSDNGVRFTSTSNYATYTVQNNVVVLASGYEALYPQGKYFWVLNAFSGALTAAAAPGAYPTEPAFPLWQPFGVTEFGRVVYTDSGGVLTCFDPADLSGTLWTIPGYDPNFPPAIDVNNYIYVVKSASPPVVDCVHRFGSVVWSYDITSVLPSPTYSNVRIAAPPIVGPDASLLVPVDYDRVGANGTESGAALVCIGGEEIGTISPQVGIYTWTIDKTLGTGLSDVLKLRTTAASGMVCDISVNYLSGSGWLNLPEGQTVLQPGDWNTFILNVDASSLSAGTYDAEIHVVSAQAFAPLVITCTLTVTE